MTILVLSTNTKMTLLSAKETRTKYTFPHIVRDDRFQTSRHCQSDQQMSQFGRDSSRHVCLSRRGKEKRGLDWVRVMKLKPVWGTGTGINAWRSNADNLMW